MKILFAAPLLALAATSALAQSGPAPAPTFAPNPDVAEQTAPRPARWRGIPEVLAVEAAQGAIDACAANGGPHVSAVVIDSQAVPIALISADGAFTVTQRIAFYKAYASVKLNMSSNEIARKQKTDAALAAKIAADPEMGIVRGGGIPITIGNDVVGAIAVSGGKTTIQEEGCSRAGLAKIQARLAP